MTYILGKFCCTVLSVAHRSIG